MSDDDDPATPSVPIRRAPPPLQPVTVIGRRELSPRMLALSFEGEGLREMEVPEPAGSVRLLVPTDDGDGLVIPSWTGNEFLLPDGSRPVIRTFTPLRFDQGAGRLDLEIVRHRGGAVSTWAEHAGPGAEAAISGPARGIEIDQAIERWVLLGDETALPAISQLLEVLPSAVVVEVHAEISVEGAQVALPERSGASVSWHVNEHGAPGATLVEVVRALDGVGPTDHVWAAGEAASMQAIRKHLFGELGLERSAATVRGYWKPARE